MPASENLHKSRIKLLYSMHELRVGYLDGATREDIGAEDRGPSATAHVTRRSVRVLCGAICIRQLVLVLRRQLRRLDRDRQLVELAGEREWDLIAAVIHLRAGFRADVEGLIDWQGQRHGALHRLRRDDLAVHRQRSGTGTTDPAHVVEGKCSKAETVVFEVEHDGVLTGRERLRPFPADPFEREQVPGEDRPAL
jgi:hypothetical protein